MVVAEHDQHDSTSETYTNVLETSRLRPDVEPFVPKTGPAVNGQMACFMVNQQGGFSLDAPEFVPNLYGQPNGEMYTWVPNQFIVAPSTNHPRFSIPRFRDKFMRQHRNRNSHTRNGFNSSNGRSNYHDNNSNQENFHNNREHLNNYQQQRTYNKIEQRSTRGRDNHGNMNNVAEQQRTQPSSHPPPPKPIKLERKKREYKERNKVIEEVEELITPVVVPDIDESVMSYSRALTGNVVTSEVHESNKQLFQSKPPSPVLEPKLEHLEEPVENGSTEKPLRGDRRSERFVPAEGDVQGKAPFARSGGRPKPTKGSGIQLNIFSLVQQDKKVKKKKVSRNKTEERGTCVKAANQLDSSAPLVRRGKEREEGKPKKLTKMKKIIVKEKSECNDSGDEAKRTMPPNYCSQSITCELNQSLGLFLAKLREYNDRAYRTGSAHKRRYCCGLREARKYLKLNKVKCVIIPPNIDKIVSKGGLYDCVHDIVNLSSEQNVPIFYGLNKTKISKILARPKSTITSAVSVFSYDGTEALWSDVLRKASAAREHYHEDSEPATLKELSEEESSDEEGEEFEDDNNDLPLEEQDGDEEEDVTARVANESADNESVSSSFVDSGIENNEISSLSLENGHTSGEG